MDSREGKSQRTKGAQFMLEILCLPSGTVFLFFRGMNTDQTKFKTHREVVHTIKFCGS